MNTNTNLTRSNKLTVKVADGILQGDFFRTHKHLLTVSAPETGWTAPDNANKTTERESFRLWLMDNAANFGILYDPADRRTELNTRKATYKTERDVTEDAVAMVTPDIATFVAKMPMSDRILCHTITMESLAPKTHTSKGTDLTTMGIENGRYASNGNMAWFDIEGVVTMDTAKGEIYQPIQMELVSGQLKKFRMTQTQWNSEVLASMLEAGVVAEEELAPKKTKEEKSAKAETPTEDNAAKDVKYRVEYQVKNGHARGEFHVETIEVTARNAKEACKLAKEMVQSTNGYNAFNPTATRI